PTSFHGGSSGPAVGGTAPSGRSPFFLGGASFVALAAFLFRSRSLIRGSAAARRVPRESRASTLRPTMRARAARDGVSRREVLGLGGAAAAAALAGGCASRLAAPTPLSASAPPQRRLERVLVDPERIIRRVVGLRPYRPSGFVVRAERLGDKLLVHDYGHG